MSLSTHNVKCCCIERFAAFIFSSWLTYKYTRIYRRRNLDLLVVPSSLSNARLTKTMRSDNTYPCFMFDTRCYGEASYDVLL